MTRLAVGVPLRCPHLVLPNTSGDDRLTVGLLAHKLRGGQRAHVGDVESLATAQRGQAVRLDKHSPVRHWGGSCGVPARGIPSRYTVGLPGCTAPVSVCGTGSEELVEEHQQQAMHTTLGRHLRKGHIGYDALCGDSQVTVICSRSSFVLGGNQNARALGMPPAQALSS